MTEPIESLLRSLRRRIWRTRARAALHHALMLAALLCVLVGIVHRWVVAIPSLASLIAILVPAFAVAIWTIVRARPTLEHCARAADRRWGTQDLLTTAWEISRSNRTSGPAGAVVMARARTLAAARNVRSEWPIPEPRRFRSVALPAALGIAGAFLLLNRGADQAGVLAARTVTGNAAPDTLTAPAESIARTSASRPGERRERPTVETDGIVVPDPLDDGPEPLLLPDVSGSGAGAGSDLGKLATDDRPGPRLAQAFGLPDMEVRIVSVAGVESAPELTTGSDGVELDESAARTSGSVNGGAPANAGALAEWNRLSVEQRRLADRYFEHGRSPAQSDQESIR